VACATGSFNGLHPKSKFSNNTVTVSNGGKLWAGAATSVLSTGAAAPALHIGNSPAMISNIPANS